jgi:hypothetical protein
MERLWRAAMLVMLGTCFAKPEDWYDVNDIDGHIAGQQFACGVCNVLVAATTDLLKAKVRCTSPQLVPCVKASIAVSDPGGPDAEVLQYGLRQGTFASLARAHATMPLMPLRRWFVCGRRKRTQRRENSAIGSLKTPAKT